MHDDETINVCSPLLRYGGAHVTNDGAAVAAVADAFVDGKYKDGGLQEEERFDYMDAVTVAVEDVAAGAGGGGLLKGGDDDYIASNVDGFFDNFLGFMGSEAEAAGAADFGDVMDIADEDLAWLDNPDAFLPLPLPSAAGAVLAERGPPPAGAQDGGAATTAASPADGVEAPETVPMQQQPQLVPQVWDVAAEVAVDAPVVMIYEAAASSEPVAAPTAAMAISGAGEERTRGDGASTPAPDAGGKGEGRVEAGAGAGGGGLSERRKEVRRQKVARYLEKKKRRKWSRASSYQSRQHVANARPRLKGRFLPLESEFMSVAELQRRKRELMKKMQGQQDHQEQGVVAGSLATLGGGAAGGQVSI